MIFDIKKIYILSAISLFSLCIITVFANFSVTNNKQEAIDNPIPTPIIVVNKIVKKVTKYVTPESNPKSINAQPTPKPNLVNNIQTSTPTAAPAPACVVTIDGVKYNVTTFRYIHSGGDIFRCGADVSNEFWGRHSQRQLNQMQQYRI